MQQIEFNGNPIDVNYFIQGQELTVKFKFESAFFIVINYNEASMSKEDIFKKRPFWFWNRYFWKLPQGEFKTLLNESYPYLTFYIVSFQLKKIVIPFKVNEIKIKKNTPTWSFNNLNYVNAFVKIDFSKYKNVENLKVEMPKMNSINYLKINNFDFNQSYDSFKQNHAKFIKKT